jgi:hypothetical protein
MTAAAGSEVSKSYFFIFIFDVSSMGQVPESAPFIEQQATVLCKSEARSRLRT